jgi:hypothetical protein
LVGLFAVERENAPGLQLCSLQVLEKLQRPGPEGPRKLAVFQGAEQVAEKGLKSHEEPEKAGLRG